MIDVVVAVVTYNSANHVRRLVESLEGGLSGVDRWELVVADNASTDGTPDLLGELRPDAKVVQMGRNAGYAAGINAAVRVAAPWDSVLVLNPDVVLRPGAVSALQRALAAPRTGVAVPRLVNPDGSLAHSLRREPTVARAWGEAILGGRRAGHHPRLGEVVRDPRQYDSPTHADWATGAAMLVSRPCYDAVGGFDESFFLYSEETDFALRARDSGYRLTYAPAAVVDHVGGESDTSPPLYALLTRNRLRLFARRHRAVPTAFFWGALVTGEALRAPRGPTHRHALRTLMGGARRAEDGSPS